jgi:hypothetical protein
MTIVSVKNDIVSHWARVAGGCCGVTLLAPNTIAQTVDIFSVLSGLELDQWIQAVANVLAPTW